MRILLGTILCKLLIKLKFSVIIGADMKLTENHIKIKLPDDCFLYNNKFSGCHFYDKNNEEFKVPENKFKICR